MSFRPPFPLCRWHEFESDRLRRVDLQNESLLLTRLMSRNENRVRAIAVEQWKVELRRHFASKCEGGWIRSDELATTTTTDTQTTIVIHFNADRELRGCGHTCIGCDAVGRCRLGDRIRFVRMLVGNAMIVLSQSEHDIARYAEYERVLRAVDHTVMIRAPAGSDTTIQEDNGRQLSTERSPLLTPRMHESTSELTLSIALSSHDSKPIACDRRICTRRYLQTAV
jgi:hypothetical protein